MRDGYRGPDGPLPICPPNVGSSVLSAPEARYCETHEPRWTIGQLLAEYWRFRREHESDQSTTEFLVWLAAEAFLPKATITMTDGSPARVQAPSMTGISAT